MLFDSDGLGGRFELGGDKEGLDSTGGEGGGETNSPVGGGIAGAGGGD